MALALIAQVAKLLTVYGGRMVAVPCRESDLYGRLWCVYEIFCAARVLKVPVKLASNMIGAGNAELPRTVGEAG